MYRDIIVRVFGEEIINKVDQLQQAGVDFTNLIYEAIMAYKENKKMSTKKYLPPFTSEEFTLIRIALTHSYGKDKGIMLFNKLMAGLN